ncbi:MAG: hypothetical protein VXX13_11615, partial [Pseudomonadota bacterium]|nr:hypothetical protein [Pseudomonadota bacterium]
MRRTFKNMHGLLAAFALAAICLASSPAHANGAGAIKYRQAVMASIGGHTRAMVAILRGSAGDPADLNQQAQGMAPLAGLGDPHLPARSGPAAGKTPAEPPILQEND